MTTKSDYQFKVGDKGKTVNGQLDYEVVLVDPSVKKGLVIRLVGVGGIAYLSQRHLDGSDILWSSTSPWDLLPPTRTVYVNLYGHGMKHINAGWYDTEAQAKTAVVGAKDVVAVAVPITIPATNRGNENGC